jgi:hypothetical protein
MGSTQFSTIPLAPAPLQRRRRWRTVLLIVALAIFVAIVLWGYTVLSTRGAWAEAEAEAALDTPRWRLMELEADRPNIPDRENSALHIIALTRMAGGFNVSAAPNYDQIFEKLPPTAQLNLQQSELIRGRLATIPRPLAEARKLKDMPRGRFPITYGDDFIGTLLPDHQRSREVAEWLQHDAFLLAQDEKCDRAVESCQAIFNAGRAMDGELLVISHLIRVAEQHISLITLERVLAQGQASEECLQGKQALLQEDLRGDGWLPAVRGERAGMHHLFDNIRTGKVQTPSFRGMGLGGGGVESITFWFIDTFPSTLLKYYPEYLRHMNRCVDIAKLPIHERAAKMQEWEADCKNTKNPVIKLLAPALSKVSQSECRNQALLRSAMVALACERYRLKHKDKDNAWPASLDVLVNEKLLGRIPTDPMDNQPIRYRRTKEGIVVYSIGFDLTDNQGNIDRERGMHEPGVDIGFRLWDVKLRRQNPLPPVAFRE